MHIFFSSRVYHMPPLHIDHRALQSLTLVHHTTRTHTIHINTRCTYEALLHYHQTRHESSYLMNAVHYKGTPLAYTHNNTLDGLCGDRVTLTYLPSSIMLRAMVRGGALYSALAMTACLLSIVPTIRIQKKTLRRKLYNTLELVTAVILLYGAYITPFKRLVSKHTDYAPFSCYPSRSTTCGKWMCAQQYDAGHKRFVMVVLAPLRLPTTLRERSLHWCALRLTSLPATHRQLHTNEYHPHHIEACVVQASSSSLAQQVKRWTSLTNHRVWAGMFDTAMSVDAYNTANTLPLCHNRYVSVYRDAFFLPIYTFARTLEKDTLNRGIPYCALRSTRLFTSHDYASAHSVTLGDAPLAQCLTDKYVHCSELHRDHVEHRLYFPLKDEVLKDNALLTFADEYYPNAVKCMDTRQGKSLCLVVHTRSNRINHTRHKTVQLYHPFEVSVFVAVMAHTQTPHSLYHTLRINHSANPSDVYSAPMAVSEWNRVYYDVCQAYEAHQKPIRSSAPSANSHNTDSCGSNDQPPRVRSQAELNAIKGYYISRKANRPRANSTSDGQRLLSSHDSSASTAQQWLNELERPPRNAFDTRKRPRTKRAPPRTPPKKTHGMKKDIVNLYI